MRLKYLIATGCLTASFLGVSTTAQAKETETSLFTCDNGQTYTMSGWARGGVFHDQESNSNYVVHYAYARGQVLYDAPGRLKDEDLVTCTTTSPLSGTFYTFKGVFTPQK